MGKLMLSNSFTNDEAKLLIFMMDTLLRGGDLSIATRHKAFFNLEGKVRRMRKRFVERKRGLL